MTAPFHAYELRSPGSADEWGRYHAIRRRVLFEARGQAYRRVDRPCDSDGRVG
jgi:hypothetical protein